MQNKSTWQKKIVVAITILVIVSVGFYFLQKNQGEFFKSSVTAPQVATSNLIAHWKFDEERGGLTASDASGHNKEAWLRSFKSSPSWYDYPVFYPVDGKFDGSVQFPTQDSYMITGVTGADTGTNFTISVWVKNMANGSLLSTSRLQKGKNFFLVGGRLGVKNCFTKPENSSLQHSCGYFSTDASLLQYSDIGGWYHVALSVNDGIATFYINGQVVSSNQSTIMSQYGGNLYRIVADGDNWQIGNDTLPNDMNEGGLSATQQKITTFAHFDEMKIFNKSLSALEISQLAAPIIRADLATPQVASSDLIAYWKMDSNPSSYLGKDEAGNDDRADVPGGNVLPKAGLFSQAADFNQNTRPGGHMKVVGNFQPIARFQPESMTISAWVKTSQTTGTMSIIEKPQEVTYYSYPSNNPYLSRGGFALRLNDGKPQFLIQGNDTTNAGVPGQVSSDDSIADGKWHLIVGVFEKDTTLTSNQGGEMRLYVITDSANNILKRRATYLVGKYNKPIGDSKADIFIGASGVYDYSGWNSDNRIYTSVLGISYYTGLVDELRIHKKALTENEILALAPFIPLREDISEKISAGDSIAAHQTKNFSIPSSILKNGLVSVSVTPQRDIGASIAALTIKTKTQLGGITAPKKENTTPQKILRIFEVTADFPTTDMESTSLQIEIAELELQFNGIEKNDVRIGWHHNGQWEAITPSISERVDDVTNAKMIKFTVHNDGFSTIILGTSIVSDPFCGNDVREGTEQCDGPSGIGPFQSCDRITCTLIDLPHCGDGVKNSSEACDDGNLLNHDGCSSQCTQEPFDQYYSPPGLIMSYSFEESAAAPKIRDSVHGVEGVLMKKPWSGEDLCNLGDQYCPKSISGKFGKGFHFDQNSQPAFIDIPTPLTNVLSDRYVFTAEAWIKVSDMTNNKRQIIFSILEGRSSNPYLSAIVLQGSKLGFANADNGSLYNNSEPGIISFDFNQNDETKSLIGKWIHVAVRKKDEGGAIVATLFVNGVNVASNLSVQKYPEPYHLARLSSTIGGAYWSRFKSDYFYEAVDEVRVYNRALLDSEIQKLSQRQMCGNAILETLDRCDDGNTAGRDGCSALCTPEAEWSWKQ